LKLAEIIGNVVLYLAFMWSFNYSFCLILLLESIIIEPSRIDKIYNFNRE